MGFWSINDLGEHTGMLANKLQVNGFFAHLREYFLADKPQVNVFLGPSRRMYITTSKLILGPSRRIYVTGS